MNPIFWFFLISGVLLFLSFYIDYARAEVIMPDLYGKWDKTPCFSFNFSKDQMPWRYPILRGAIDLRGDIGHYFKIWTIPKDGCVKVKTHSSNNTVGDWYIFGQAICNQGEIIKSCYINIWLKNLPLSKAYNTIKHEMFHTFGFGHITTTTPQEFPGLVITNDLMLSSTTIYHKFTKADKYAFDYKYGENGFLPPNNHTKGYTIIPKELVKP